MAIIKAVGKISGVKITVHCKDIGGEIHVLFNGQENIAHESRFRKELSMNHVVAGSYVPDIDSMLNALEVLKHWFFDSAPEIIIEGDIGEIPYEDGVVY
jgi:hypothetical protein